MYVNVHTHDEFCYRSDFDNETKQFINHSPAVQKFEEKCVTATDTHDWWKHLDVLPT